MLTKKESEVMMAVYTLCKEGVCLVSPSEILALLPAKQKWTLEGLEQVLSALSLDNYFEWLTSFRQGEKMYVITLRASGLSYPRCERNRKRDMLLKISWAIASAVIAFLVGWILKRIF